MAIDLYINNFYSPSSRALVALINHLNVAGQFNLKEVDINPEGERSAELLKVNPKHTVPTLVEDGGAFILWDAHVIAQYLVNRFASGSPLYPSDPKARALVDRVLFWDGTSFHPVVRSIVVAKVKKTAPSDETVAQLKQKLQGLDKHLLSSQQYLAGNAATLADIILATQVPMMKYLYPDSVSDNLTAWYERVKTAIPAVQKVHDDFKAAVAARK